VFLAYLWPLPWRLPPGGTTGDDPLPGAGTGGAATGEELAHLHYVEQFLDRARAEQAISAAAYRVLVGRLAVRQHGLLASAPAATVTALAQPRVPRSPDMNSPRASGGNRRLGRGLKACHVCLRYIAPLGACHGCAPSSRRSGERAAPVAAAAAVAMEAPGQFAARLQAFFAPPQNRCPELRPAQPRTRISGRRDRAPARAARHADPRTTMRYDRARKNLDRHPNYILAAYTASGT
jgi:hypothetical protein